MPRACGQFPKDAISITGSRWRCERGQQDSATAHISSTGLVDAQVRHQPLARLQNDGWHTVDEPIDRKPFGRPARKSPRCNYAVPTLRSDVFGEVSSCTDRDLCATEPNNSATVWPLPLRIPNQERRISECQSQGELRCASSECLLARPFLWFGQVKVADLVVRGRGKPHPPF